jgi:hypothetical protein
MMGGDSEGDHHDLRYWGQAQTRGQAQEPLLLITDGPTPRRGRFKTFQQTIRQHSGPATTMYLQTMMTRDRYVEN